MKKQKATTLDGVMQEINKKCGPNTITTGDKIIYNPARIPFGVFALDLCIAGGIPLWGSTCLWGPESGGKTTLVIKLIKMCSMLCWRCFNLKTYCTCSEESLLMKAAVADIEGTLDIAWMEASGVSKEDYYLIQGDCAEEFFDTAETCLQADDCGLVVIDSLGSSAKESEMGGSLISTNMGQDPHLATRAVKKLKQRLIREKKRLHPCTVVYTNQMRSDLQKMFGSKESMPGGHAAMHEFSLLLRCIKKAFNDADKKKFIDDVNKTNMASRHSVTVKKSKIFTIAGASEFIIVKDNIPNTILKKGDIDDYRLTINYARDRGIIENKSGYKIRGFDDKFDKIDDIITMFHNNIEAYLKIQQDIIKKVIK